MWRTGLWKKIWDIGIKGKFWRILINFYRNTSSKIRLGNNLSESFTTSLGVKQGGVLSPILFSIFFNELIDTINSTNTGIKWTTISINCLLYADDIVIITKNAKDLKKCLTKITEYGIKWRCSFNGKKSQVVIHGRKIKNEHIFQIGNKILKQVQSYKYLGIEIQRNLNWKTYKDRILGKAKKITTMIKAMFLKNNKILITTMCKIWDSLVRPILEYGSEIWGFKEWPEAEILHRNYGRFLLGHYRNSTKGSIYGDLGWIDMHTRSNIIKLRYWKKMTEQNELRQNVA